jgi:hypothetical protein
MTQTRRRVVLTGTGGRIGRAITSCELGRSGHRRPRPVRASGRPGRRHCGVRRLVLASSLHAVCAASDQTQVGVGDPPRPGNLYGATKAWAEPLGAWVAATTPTSVVALRIGYFSWRRPDAGTVSTQELSAWLSPRDAAELVRAAVETVGLTFVVANASPLIATAVPTCRKRCSNWATVRSTTPGNLSRPIYGTSHSVRASRPAVRERLPDQISSPTHSRRCRESKVAEGTT